MSLASTLVRLEALEPWWTTLVGSPEGDAWARFDELDIAPWVDAIAAEHDGRRDVAASYLGAWLGAAAVAVPVAALVLDGAVPLPGPPRWVRRHAGGWVDGVGYDLATPMGTRADIGGFAAAAVETLAPHLGAIRASAPFGSRGLWSSVADEVAAIALWTAREAGTDVAAAWSTAEEVIAAIGEHAPCRLNRPRPFPFAATMYAVKGTCCLYFKTNPGDECTSCPRRDDESRRERLATL